MNTKPHQSIRDWLALCASTPELVANYDRLRGTNIASAGSPLEALIDSQSGRLDAELRGFVEFAVDLFRRLP